MSELTGLHRGLDLKAFGLKNDESMELLLQYKSIKILKTTSHMTRMDPAEIRRREHLYQDDVGDVVLIKSALPDTPHQVSFKNQSTLNPDIVFESASRRLTKEQQQNFEGNKLRIQYNGPTTRAVRRTFADAGFVSVRKDDRRFHLCWGSPKGLEYYQTLQPGQTCNQIPGSNSMGRKDTLACFIQQAQQRQPAHYDFVPLTFVLPADVEALNEDKGTQEETNTMYIYKPAMAARGNGIIVFSPRDPVPDEQTPAVVQRYIQNPLLLQGFKFDLRIYVLITSIDPLIIYFYDEGLGRFATEKFVAPNDENKSHTRMHLTNFSVNCQAEQFKDGSAKKSDGDDDQIVNLADDLPSKWKLTELLAYLDCHREVFSQSEESIVHKVAEANGALAKELRRRLERLVKLTMIAVEPRLYQFTEKARALHEYPRRHFGLYGFDIMLTDEGSPLLIEVNSSPATGTSTQLDVEVKFELLSDLMHLVGLPVNVTENDQIAVPEQMPSPEQEEYRRIAGETDPNISQFMLQPDEQMFTMTTQQLLTNGVYKQIEIDKLSRFEKRAMLQIFDEGQRLGRFVRLVPDGIDDTGELFEQRRYLNDLAGTVIKQRAGIDEFL